MYLGYIGMVYTMVPICFLWFIIWAHHRYTVGLDVDARAYFTEATMIITVTSRIKMVSWIATKWEGSTYLKVPMLFEICFNCLFTMGI
jgi:cytochrome c oxidase subunit I